MRIFILVLMLSLTGFAGQKQPFIEPPFIINNESFENALEILFARAGDNIKYSIEVPDAKTYGTVNVKFMDTVHLKIALNSVLEPKGLVFYVDKDSVYHIVECDKEAELYISEKPLNTEQFKFLSEEEKKIYGENKNLVNKKYYFEPPLEFVNMRVCDVLKEIFKTTSVKYDWYYDWTFDLRFEKNQRINFKIEKNTGLDDILKAILSPLDFKFIKDYNGKYCILPKDKEIKMVTKLYPVTHENAIYLVRQICGVLTRNGRIEKDNNSNSIIVTDEEKHHEGVVNLLKELDGWGR